MQIPLVVRGLLNLLPVKIRPTQMRCERFPFEQFATEM
jgi:hypothetical protein